MGVRIRNTLWPKKLPNKILIVSVLMTFLYGPVNSQAKNTISKDTTTWNLFTYDMKYIFGGIGHAYSRPLYWKGDNWLVFGGTVLGTIALYTIDHTTTEFFRDQEDKIPHFIEQYGWKVGNPQNNYAITGAVYFTGLFTKSEKWRRLGVLMLSSASAAGLLQQALKYPLGRARPRTGLGKDTFDPFSSDAEYHSFPSGHAILAFTNGHAIAKQFKSIWAKAGIYTVSAVPGLSRLWNGAHWFSDVALSAAISIFTVETIDRYLDGKYDPTGQRDKNRIDWSVQVLPGKVGIVGRF